VLLPLSLAIPSGIATVYRARDLRHERPVAIKLMRPELAAGLVPVRARMPS
jgi:hypothetical protein